MKKDLKSKVLRTFEDKEGLLLLFHAGTKLDDNGKIVTNGGRVSWRYSKG